jgi:hypothetical protein
MTRLGFFTVEHDGGTHDRIMVPMYAFHDFKKNIRQVDNLQVMYTEKKGGLVPNGVSAAYCYAALNHLICNNDLTCQVYVKFTQLKTKLAEAEQSSGHPLFLLTRIQSDAILGSRDVANLKAGSAVSTKTKAECTVYKIEYLKSI